MVDINIPFNRWSKDKLKRRKKVATSRPDKYAKIGDTFSVDGVKYVVTFVVKFPLFVVRDFLYKTEGAKSPKEFEDVWVDLHPVRGWDSDWRVWYHFFSEVKKES